MGRRSDGAVVAVGSHAVGECRTGEWRDVVAVAAGAEHTLGVRADGSVLSAGANDYGQRNVDGWSLIDA